MSKVNNFDVLKRMSAENMGIEASPDENIIGMQLCKAGTQITIGVAGNVIGGIASGEKRCVMLIWDKREFEELKAKMEAE